MPDLHRALWKSNENVTNILRRALLGAGIGPLDSLHVLIVPLVLIAFGVALMDFTVSRDDP